MEDGVALILVYSFVLEQNFAGSFMTIAPAQLSLAGCAKAIIEQHKKKKKVNCFFIVIYFSK
jgi:hypothetical protein